MTKSLEARYVVMVVLKLYQNISDWEIIMADGAAIKLELMLNLCRSQERLCSVMLYYGVPFIYISVGQNLQCQ